MILLEPMRFVVDSSCSGSTHIFCIANKVLVDLIWIHVADTVDLSLMNHLFMFVMADHICMS